VLGRLDAAPILGTSISGAVPAELERGFRRYDTNKTGALSRTELKVALSPPPWYPAGARPDASSISGNNSSISGISSIPAEVERVFRRYDTNKTNAISRTELKVALSPPLVSRRC